MPQREERQTRSTHRVRDHRHRIDREATRYSSSARLGAQGTIELEDAIVFTITSRQDR